MQKVDAVAPLAGTTRSGDASAPSSAPAGAPATTTKRILIVDDSRTMRLMLRRWLATLNCDIAVAENGDEAFDVLTKQSFDLVTVDVDMPVLDGFGLCAKLREWEQEHARPQTPILVVTSHDTLADRERGFEVGATDFLAKPVTESEFLARVGRLLRANDQLLGLTALVVDDSRVSRKSIAFSVAQYGINVIEAEDGVQAFQILEARAKDIDLVLTDLDMPRIDGAELCRRARTALGLPWLPIIILSAIGDRARVLELYRVGATDYLCKPFTVEELVARISVHTEIRRLSRERARHIAELERVNDVKNRLLAIASHDMRSPVAGIVGATDVLLGDDTLSPQHREIAALIRKSGDNLLEIINDVLELARIEAGKAVSTFNTFDMTALAAQACRSLQHLAAAKGITVEQQPPAGTGEPVIAYGAQSDVSRLVTNLVSNAIKFTQRDGKVAVAVSSVPDKSARIVVSDDGIGIAPEKLPLLFERFSRISQAGTAGELSTGLGMAIVKEIVERHTGTITVASQIGKGTTVTVTLPPRG